MSNIRREFMRSLRNHQYEITPEGILFPKAGALATGWFVHDVNGQDIRFDKNKLVNEGMVHMLGVTLSNTAQKSAWYVGLFSANVTPAATVTAASWVADLTEFTNYDEAARPEWVEGAAANNSISNTNNKAAFTIATGGGTVNGAVLISSQTKSGVDGTLMAAAKFSASRTLLATDVLNIGYTVSLAST